MITFIVENQLAPNTVRWRRCNDAEMEEACTIEILQDERAFTVNQCSVPAELHAEAMGGDLRFEIEGLTMLHEMTHS